MAKTTADIRSLARNHTAKALSTLASIMNATKAPAAARVQAAQALLDRGWGKPNLIIEANVNTNYVVSAEPIINVADWESEYSQTH
jgi:hypothetical protein